jgi:hypothetical protein
VLPWILGRALVVSTIVITGPSAHVLHQRSDSLAARRAALEIEKLQLEIARLSEWWFDAGLLGFLAGAAAAVGSLWIARRARRGTLDQSVHDKRLDSYPKLVEATAPLSIYFPSPNPAPGCIGPGDCSAMGRNMSSWYFGGGGLLMSTRSRKAYFRLIRALTRAASSAELRGPTFPQDAEKVSVEKLKDYRKELNCGFEDKDVEEWEFGLLVPSNEAHRFRDYVFLQELSSALRTALATDLRSRRRPT